MKQMTVEQIMELLSTYEGNREIYTMTRARDGASITAINYVGLDQYGNLVITLKEATK